MVQEAFVEISNQMILNINPKMRLSGYFLKIEMKANLFLFLI